MGIEIVETARLNSDYAQNCSRCGNSSGPFVELQMLARLVGNEQFGAYYLCVNNCAEELVREVGYVSQSRFDETAERADLAEQRYAGLVATTKSEAAKVARLEKQLSQERAQVIAVTGERDGALRQLAEFRLDPIERARGELRDQLAAVAESKPTSRKRKVPA